LGGLLDLLEEAESVFAEDFADVGIGIALVEEGLGELGEMGGVFHADGHGGTIEIGAEADMINAGDFDGVVDVIDDFGPIDFGEFACFHELAHDLFAESVAAGFIIAAALFDFGGDFLANFGMGDIEIEILLTEKADVVIDLDDATVFGEITEHVVGHVAGGAAESAARGVGGEDGGGGSGENVVEGFVGNVGDVHDDAETVHFADDILAEGGEAVVFGLGGGGIGPLVVLHVGEGHVTDAESGEGAEDGEIVAHHVATFDTDEGGDFVLGAGGTDFGGGSGEDEIVGIFADGFADGIDLIEGLLDGVGAEDFAGDVDGEEEGG